MAASPGRMELAAAIWAPSPAMRRVMDRRCSVLTGDLAWQPDARNELKSCSPSRCRAAACMRSEEHTSELQSQSNLVCRLLLEKKKKTNTILQPHLYNIA